MTAAAALVQLLGYAPQPARDDIHVTRARVLETSAWIAFRHDRHEAARREDHGLGAVLAWDLLDTLMDLPAGLPVPITALTRPARQRVCTAAPGVARVADGQVTRDLVPVVTPLLAIVIGGHWDDTLVRASRFAPYCPRMVVWPELAGGADALGIAARLGIGVAVRTGSGPAEVLLEPELVPGWQPTTAWWRFCEAVYGQASAAAAKRSGNRGGNVCDPGRQS
jgi:hypothetical protein